MKELNINYAIDSKVSAYAEAIDTVSSLAELALSNSTTELSNSTAYLSLTLAIENIADSFKQYVESNKEEKMTIEEYIEFVAQDEDLSSELSILEEISSEMSDDIDIENQSMLSTIKVLSRQALVSSLIDDGTISSEEDLHIMSEIELIQAINKYEEEHPGCFDDELTETKKRDTNNCVAEFNAGVNYGKLFFTTLKNKASICKSINIDSNSENKVDFSEAFGDDLCKNARKYFIALENVNAFIESSINSINSSNGFYALGFFLAASGSNRKINNVKKALTIVKNENFETKYERYEDEGFKLELIDNEILASLCGKQNVSFDDVTPEEKETINKVAPNLSEKGKRALAVFAKIMSKYSKDNYELAVKTRGITPGKWYAIWAYVGACVGALVGLLGGLASLLAGAAIGLIVGLVVGLIVFLICCMFGAYPFGSKLSRSNTQVNVLDFSSDMIEAQYDVFNRIANILKPLNEKLIDVCYKDLLIHHDEIDDPEPPSDYDTVKLLSITTHKGNYGFYKDAECTMPVYTSGTTPLTASHAVVGSCRVYFKDGNEVWRDDMEWGTTTPNFPIVPEAEGVPSHDLFNFYWIPYGGDGTTKYAEGSPIPVEDYRVELDPAEEHWQDISTTAAANQKARDVGDFSFYYAAEPK